MLSAPLGGVFLVRVLYVVVQKVAERLSRKPQASAALTPTVESA